MSFLVPKFMFHRVTDITVDFLKEAGVENLLLDADNTLSTHHSQEPYAGVAEWLELMRQNGIGLMMVSNSNVNRVTPFAKKLGLDFEYMSLKPLSKGVGRAMKRLGAKRENTALVGDQIFTDLLAARLKGIKILFVEYIKKEEKMSFKIRRALEKKILKNKEYIRKVGK